MSITAVVGNEVEIAYTGKLKQNSIVFDSTDEKNPFKFVVGSKDIIKGINDAVVGMKIGEKKSVEIPPEDAYGQYYDKLLAKIPKKNIPETAKVGDVLTDSNGNNWWIRNIDGDFVEIDGNHPLAGEILIFEIELIKINH